MADRFGLRHPRHGAGRVRGPGERPARRLRGLPHPHLSLGAGMGRGRAPQLLGLRGQSATAACHHRVACRHRGQPTFRQLRQPLRQPDLLAALLQRRSHHEPPWSRHQRAGEHRSRRRRLLGLSPRAAGMIVAVALTIAGSDSGGGAGIQAVAAAIRDHGIINLVVDPVMVAKGGARLLHSDAIASLYRYLLPLAAVVTPNIPEAEVLLGRSLPTVDDRRQAARDLVALGPRAAVVKGGHAADAEAIDIYWDGRDLVELAGRRINTKNTHGSGCVFSAAITAGLAKGQSPLEAVRAAKAFINGAIEHSLELGKGHGPVNPVYERRD